MPGQGVFSLGCPSCGSALKIAPDASASCPVCRRRFTVRVGHLIPMAPIDAEPAKEAVR